MNSVDSRTAARRWRTVGVALVLGMWPLVVAILIARTPPSGETAPGRLAASWERAVNARDSSGLERLVDSPEPAEFADEYLDALAAAEPGPVRVTVTQRAEPTLTVAALANRGAASHTLRVVEQDGRWLVSVVPFFE